MKKFHFSIISCLIFFLIACNTTKKSYSNTTKNKKLVTIASYYHQKFNGRKTASGELFSNNKLTAAHRTYPFGTLLKVTNVINGKSVIVKVNDRGPFVKVKGKGLDLSRKAFMEITDNTNKGNLEVTIEVIK